MSTEFKTFTEAEMISEVMYDDWTVWWWNWALKGPRADNPVYDTTGKNAHRYQPPDNYHVKFLAGTFDRESQNGKVTRSISLGKDFSLLIPIVNSNLSREQHNRVFQPGNSNAKVIGAADEIINQAQGSLRIETGGSSVDYTIGGSGNLAPVRIKPRSGLNLMYPGQGIIQNNDHKEIDFMYSAVDGYWVFLSPIPSGRYTFIIHGSAPWFGPEKEAPTRFETDVTYDVEIGA